MAMTEKVADRRLLGAGDEIWQSGRWVTVTRIAPSMCGKRTNVFAEGTHLFSFTDEDATRGQVTRRVPVQPPLWGRIVDGVFLVSP
jgi:hypothetical protein